MLSKFFNTLKRKYVYSILLALLVCCSIPFTVNNSKAVGNHSSHSSISSSSGSSFGSSSSSSSGGGYIRFSSTRTTKNGTRIDTIGSIAVIIVILLIKFIIESSNSSRSNQSRNIKAPARPTELVLENIRDLKKRDPNFSSSEFIAKTQNIFLTLQNAWTTKEWDIARMYETDSLYNTHKKQIDELIRKNRTNHIEDIAILETRILDCYSDSNFDILDVLFDVNLVDYTVDDNTNRVINGSPDKHIRLKYTYTFIRPKNAITKDNDNNLAKYCPSCGAPTNVNASGICEYCETVLISKEHDWVLSSIKDSPYA